jgi:hypothetical protein
MTLNFEPDVINFPTLTCAGHTTCQQPATYIVAIHQVDCCQPRGGHQLGRNLTPNGDTILLLCTQCLTATAQLITHEIRRRLQRLGDDGRNCGTCGQRTDTLHHILDTETL